MVKKRLTKDSAKARAAKSAAAKAAATARAHAHERAIIASNTLPARQLNGFFDFVREQGVVGLAIGLVFGTQVKVLVDQIILTFINPILGWLLPGDGDLTKKTFTITLNGESAVFTYGAFISVLLSFLAVAAIIYFAYKALSLDRLDKKKKD